MITFETIEHKNKWFDTVTACTFTYLATNAINKFNLTLIIARWLNEHRHEENPTDIGDIISDEQLYNLRYNNNTFFIIQNEQEAWIPTSIFKMLYANCNKYNISPNKMIVISSNLNIDQTLHTYNRDNNISNSIKAFGFMAFKLSSRGINSDEFSKPTTDMYRYYRTLVKNTYSGKFFLSLSRRARHHRNVLQFLLNTSPILKGFGIISQDKINDTHAIHVGRLTHTDPTILLEWAKTLPLIADTTDFITNHNKNMNVTLQSSTLFQVIGETYGDYDEGGLFYSEKTFKPIRGMQPFIIAGQQHANKKLADNGFKLYTDWFDYSFDDEPDMPTRYKMLTKEVERLTIYLNKLSYSDQIAWRFKNPCVLIDNYSEFRDISTQENQILHILTSLIRSNR